MIVLSGAQLCRMLRFVFRDEVWEGAHCEFHQFSRGMRVVYGGAMRTFLEMSLDGEPIRDDRKYTVGIEQLHLVNLEEFWNRVRFGKLHLCLGESAGGSTTRVGEAGSSGIVAGGHPAAQSDFYFVGNRGRG